MLLLHVMLHCFYNERQLQMMSSRVRTKYPHSVQKWKYFSYSLLLSNYLPKPIYSICRFVFFSGIDHHVLHTVRCFFSSALASVYVSSLQSIRTWKKWRLQERPKFPQFSFSPQNAGTGNMHSVPWFLHTHGHKCDNHTIKGYF